MGNETTSCLSFPPPTHTQDTTSDEPPSLSKRKPNEENGEGKEKAAFKRAKSCYSGTRL